jgi:hypothetical protein
VNDIRLISPQYIMGDTPFWDALRDAGYNKLVRPNMPVAGTLPCVRAHHRLPVCVAPPCVDLIVARRRCPVLLS